MKNHLSPLIGEVSLSNVGNKTLKSAVARLSGKKLAPATIKNITLVAKLVVTQRLEPVSINSTVVKDFRKVNWVLILRS